jgi:murein DD-endopeptidase MepM/ murein hydrolase activator NlpD
VRLFPRTARHRLAAASAACTLVIGAVAIPLANANDDLKHQQHHVQGQIRSAGHDLDESSSRLRHAAALLVRARDQLSHARSELQAAHRRLDAAAIRDREMQARLDAAVERLADAQGDLVTGQQALDDQRVHVTGTITSIYEEGDPQLLAFSSLLDAQTPADLARRMEARNVIVGRETRAYDDLHAAEVLLKVRENEVEAARDEVAAQRAAAAEHLVTMQDLVEKTREARAEVLRLVDSRRDARAAAVKARRHDRAVLARLHRHENRIKQRILAQARRAARHSRAGYSGRTGGFLNRPVSGPVTSPFGWREHPIYHYWGLHDGDDFGAGCGQPLYAVASGTVMSEYYSSVWGNRLYLNVGTVNGKNITVIYNHLSRYQAHRGQHVGRGQVVGNVGTTGWSTGCHLHFTVMVNGTPVNPLNWM